MKFSGFFLLVVKYVRPKAVCQSFALMGERTDIKSALTAPPPSCR